MWIKTFIDEGKYISILTHKAELIQDELFEEGNELDNRAFDDCLEQEDGGLVIYNIMMRAQKSKPLMAALKKQLNEENFKQWSLVHKIVVEKTSPQQTNLF